MLRLHFAVRELRKECGEGEKTKKHLQNSCIFFIAATKRTKHLNFVAILSLLHNL